MNKKVCGSMSLARITSILLVTFSMTGCAVGPVSLNGISLVADPYTQASGTSQRLGYLSDGEAIAFENGDVFSFAPIQLHHGEKIKSLRCVVKDNTKSGYIQVNLIRGPINTVDLVGPPLQLISSVGTMPNQTSPDFIELSSNARIEFATVDNTKYGYFLRADFLDNSIPSPPETTLSLRGCIIEYAK